MVSVTTKHSYDRLKEVKQFDESKMGVKGLLDTGITTIPPFFHQPPENLPSQQPKNHPHLAVPVIDLSRDRSTIVEEIKQGSSTLGFFQIVNHSIPVTLINSVINDTKKFYEQSSEYKMKYYQRDGVEKGATYCTNFDLYQSKAASWRDTIEIMSNDEYKSVEHRVLANNVEGARVSAAVLFNPSNRGNLYGPFPDIISDEKPALYKEFIYADFIRRFSVKEIDGKRKIDFCRIDDTNNESEPKLTSEDRPKIQQDHVAHE